MGNSTAACDRLQVPPFCFVMRSTWTQFSAAKVQSSALVGGGGREGRERERERERGREREREREREKGSAPHTQHLC